MGNIIQTLQDISIFDVCSLLDILKCLGVFFLFYIFRTTLAYYVVRLINLKEKDKEKIKKNGLYQPLKLFFLLLGIYLGLGFIKFSAGFTTLLNKVFRISIILIIAKALANIFSKKSRFMTKLNKKLHMTNSSNITGMVSKVIIGIIYAFAIVIVINELGYDINGLIAGLGLGGLTIALAAQDAASNVFGGLVIVFDKPFIIGDWIKTSEIEGIVEEITFRSTRIRTFDNTLVVIPNNKITNDTVINCSKMEKRRIKFDLQLEMNVDMKKLNDCIEKVRKMLNSNDKLIKESILVFFDRVEDSGYNMFVSCFTTELNYADYLQIRENINFKLIELLNKENVGLAYPSTTVYLKK